MKNQDCYNILFSSCLKAYHPLGPLKEKGGQFFYGNTHFSTPSAPFKGVAIVATGAAPPT